MGDVIINQQDDFENETKAKDYYTQNYKEEVKGRSFMTSATLGGGGVTQILTYADRGVCVCVRLKKLILKDILDKRKIV